MGKARSRRALQWLRLEDSSPPMRAAAASTAVSGPDSRTSKTPSWWQVPDIGEKRRAQVRIQAKACCAPHRKRQLRST